MKKMFKNLIFGSLNRLKESELSLKTVYDITFSEPSFIMAEENDGYKITSYTYGEVKEKIEKTADAIYDIIGATHNYVGLAMENSVDWVVAFWAILKSGNKPYLVNLRHPDSLSQKIINNLGIKTVICDKKGKLDAHYIEFNDLSGGVMEIDEFEDEIALASSGTSLSETICFYNGKNISAQIFNTEKIVKENRGIYAHYKGSLKQLAFLPFYHVFGLFAVYFWFTFFKRTVVFLKDMSADTILATCKMHKVTHIFAVPMLWHTVEKKVIKTAEQQGKAQKLQKALEFSEKLQSILPIKTGTFFAKKLLKSVTDKIFGDSLLFCISGGSFLKPSALKLINALGYPLYNGFGMSEIGITSVELSKKIKVRNKNSIGKPFASVEYFIDNDKVLTVKGDSLCFKRLKDGKEIFDNGVFTTGDLAETDQSGSYYIKGRMGDTVIGENGENINPDIIEAMFDIKDALNVSVLGIEDTLSMVVQISPYLPIKKKEKMRLYIEEINAKLSLLSQIKRFYVTFDSIMAQTAIKVSRKYLIREIENGKIKLFPFEKCETTDYEVYENTALLEKVIEIVVKVTGEENEKIPTDTNLLSDLEISSIQYFSILSALAEEFDLVAKSDDKYLFTIREMCEYIERQL